MQTETFKQKMIAYYTKYYRDDCSLRDWEKRVQNRLNEESWDRDRLAKLSDFYGFSFHNKKHCIIGAGTAGLASVLRTDYASEVYGVEPSDEEFEIIRERCQMLGINPDNFKKEYGEKVSFETSSFDFVHSVTVLEHVESIEKCIDEMIRIAKVGGYIYIDTPNYSFPYEPHYKIVFPTFLPKIFGAIFLKLLGKSARFLGTINYITPRHIDKILAKRDDVAWARLYCPQHRSTGRFARTLNFLKLDRFIYPNQEIIIKKLK